MAMLKVFLDTNIILDVLCQRSECATAATVLNMGLAGVLDLYITNLTLANVLYIARKDIGKELALVKIQELCRFIHIAPCGQDEADKALSTPNPDFEDALQNFSAEAVNADIILTRNGKHFKYSSLPVMDCSAFLTRY